MMKHRYYLYLTELWVDLLYIKFFEIIKYYAHYYSLCGSANTSGCVVDGLGATVVH